MGKGFVLIDIPESCEKCRFFSFDIAGCYCIVSDDENNPDYYRETTIKHGAKKPEWCPIRKLPEKDLKNYYSDEYLSRYADGWNTCVNCLASKDNG